jgi:hypothetical protein
MRMRTKAPLALNMVGLAALALAASGLAGCDNMKKGFDKGFNEAFDKKMHDSCVQSAVAHQASADAAEKYCSCIVQHLSGLSVQEKEALKEDSPQAQQAVAQCRPTS